MQNLIDFCSGSCGDEFTETIGHISSPLYPNNYPANADCIYTISQPTGTVIKLNFLSMNIYKMEVNSPCKNGDYLEFRDDGPFFTQFSPDDVTLCGSEIPAPITSIGNKLWMK